MGLHELSALARRQVIPILAVFLVVLGIAYSFKKTPPVSVSPATWSSSQPRLLRILISRRTTLTR